jgi:hypothetical protein
MQNLRFTIAAGETKNFGAISGAYLEVIEAAGAITLGLYDAAGSQSDDARDIYSGFYVEGKFAGFEVYSAVAQTIELLITNGRGGTRRQPGNVKVIDQGIDKTRAGNQFVGAPALNGVAAVFSIVSVYPAAKIAAIKRLLVSCATAGTIYIGTGTGAPTTNPVAQGGMRNKLIGGAVSDMQRALGTCAAQPPTVGEVPGYSGLFTMPVPANSYVEIPLTTPIVIGPGQYLVIVGAAINSNVSALIDWEEV